MEELAQRSPALALELLRAAGGDGDADARDPVQAGAPRRWRAAARQPA
jgi:hypothetical protein